MSQRIITGIKPTGTPHLGNYVGAIAPALALAAEPGVESFLFVADGHALNSIRDPAELRRFSVEVVAAFLAFEPGPRAVVYRQSDVAEIFELAMILGCLLPKGAADRAHAYKAAVDTNLEAGRDRDAGINLGLYTYPLLMAADILGVGATAVPIGDDQRQHLEVTRSLARRLVSIEPGLVAMPEARARPGLGAIPGLDGRKMSKSYGNTIPLFARSAELRKLIARIRTDPRPLGEPIDPDGSPLFALYRAFATSEEQAAMRRRFASGAGYGEIKELLFAAIDDRLRPARDRYGDLIAAPAEIERRLGEGAARVRAVAAPILEGIKVAVGLAPAPGALGTAPRPTAREAGSRAR